MTNTSTLTTQTYDLPTGYDRFLVSSRMSPDGQYLAALVGVTGTEGGQAIWIFDRLRDKATVVSDPGTHFEFLAWAPAGDQLFATGYSYGRTRTPVWRYRGGEEFLTAVVLPFGGGISPVVIDASMADAYFADQDADF